MTEAKEPLGGLYFKQVPEITAACVYHKGPYGTLGQSYAAALAFVKENGYTIAGSIREKYIDGVWNKEDEAEWLTEIQIPVAKEENA